MKALFKKLSIDPRFSISIGFLLSISIFMLNAIAPSLFPSYYIYIVISLITFFIFAGIDFEVLRLFSKHLYVASVILLLVTLIIGQATRGTIRWIPIGGLSFQPAEIVRPFLILFFADFLTVMNFNIKRVIKAIILLFIPSFLILVQPSLSVTVLLGVGFFGVILANDFDKKNILAGIGIFLLLMPVFWFLLKPYQQDRIINFATPSKDPLGAGYNAVQSMIAVGSGKIFGRTLGKGIQTQLAFLPEKQTDFIFAAIAEELGLLGASILLLSVFLLFWRLSVFMQKAINPVARAYLSGIFLTLFVQVFVHVGMNMGLLPIAGLPFPLVSAGGSSLLATSIGLGIALRAYRR